MSYLYVLLLLLEKRYSNDFFFFAVTVIRYNRITDSKNVGLVSPNPHSTEKELETQREWWREKLQESLLTLKSGCFHLSAILLNTSLTLWSNMLRIWMVTTHNEGDDWDGRASSCYIGTCISFFQILQVMAYLLYQWLSASMAKEEWIC